jgi:hypothetical protein
MLALLLVAVVEAGAMSPQVQRKDKCRLGMWALLYMLHRLRESSTCATAASFVMELLTMGRR